MFHDQKNTQNFFHQKWYTRKIGLTLIALVGYSAGYLNG